MPEENSNQQPARRQFIGSLVAGAAVSAAAGSAAGAPAQARPGSLFDKMYGCIAGVYIGSGHPVQGR